jgi:hypothetical protein
MVHHKPNDSRFLCTAKDMTRQAIRREQLLPAQRWEVEANEFASLILMPPPLWRKAMATYRHPDLGHIAALRRIFKVSNDAAARTYATYHDEAVAVAVVKDGALQRVYRNPTRFSFLALAEGDPIPRASNLSSRGENPCSAFGHCGGEGRILVALRLGPTSPGTLRTGPVQARRLCLHPALGGEGRDAR